jgi:alanine racemase
MEIGHEYAENSSWVELSRSAFLNNVDAYRGVVESHVQLGCVLKGNAYGHGFKESLRILHDLTDILFVINPVDAFRIRNYEKEYSVPHKRVVVIGAITQNEIVDCAKRFIEVALTDDRWEDDGFFEALQGAETKSPGAYRPLKVHIHIDTGLGREGIFIESLPSVISTLKKYSHLVHIQAVMSHFSNVEDVTEQDYAHDQIAILEKAHHIVVQSAHLSHPVEKHIAQSAATFVLPQCRFEIVRPGISLYGLWASPETRISARVVMSELPKLKPVLSWRCKSQYVKQIHAGNYVGYGCTYRAEHAMRIAVLPVGYFDGYPRLLSHKAHVLVNGHRCSVLGRVMMNHVVVDITNAAHNNEPIVATLLGTDGRETVSADMLGTWADTINYEIVTRIGPHLKRVILP